MLSPLGFILVDESYIYIWYGIEIFINDLLYKSNNKKDFPLISRVDTKHKKIRLFFFLIKKMYYFLKSFSSNK